MRTPLSRKDISPKRLAEGEKPDDYLAKLAKMIPAEVVSFYIISTGAITAAEGEVPKDALAWLVFGVGLLATALLAWITAKKDLTAAKADFIEQRAGWKTVFTTFGFFVWVFALGGPFTQITGYFTVYGTLLMMIYTLLAPAFYDLIPIPLRKTNPPPP